MAVDLAAAFTYGAKRYHCNKKNKHLLLPVSPLAFNPKASNYLIIRFPNSQIWKIFYRLLVVALLFVASFPLISSSLVSRIPLEYSTTSINLDPQQQEATPEHGSDNSLNMDQLLTLLFNDLTNEGLMKKTPQQHKAVFLSNAKGTSSSEEEEQEEGLGFQVFNMDPIPLNDMEHQNSILDDTVDFIFTRNFPASSQFIDRTLKTDGILTVLLNDNPSVAYYKLSNYNVVYMRRFEKAVAIAMKKTAPAGETKLVGPKRKLCGYVPEAKKAALEKLEDVLLEPPRAASGKSRVYLKRTRYLPDLMGDSLESYPRRVFIDVGLPERDGTDWFHKNYPTRNKNFEMYKIETVTEGSTASQVEMSDWLRKNVREEEYVVMKAEAEVVEEMMRSKAILLVDELFLECKPRGLKQQGNNRSRRAYWECLALYGKLRDQGVAVHQWWG